MDRISLLLISDNPYRFASESNNSLQVQIIRNPIIGGQKKTAHLFHQRTHCSVFSIDLKNKKCSLCFI
jgi:hypothetical protein